MTATNNRFNDVFVSNVMTTDVESIDADASASQAARRLTESDIGSLLVGTETPPPAGIITESDFVDLARDERDPASTPVETCMSSPVETIDPTASIETAAGSMSTHDIKKLPVVDTHDDAIVGIITTTDIAKYLPVHEFHPEDTA